jgi:hypothetical protein
MMADATAASAPTPELARPHHAPLAFIEKLRLTAASLVAILLLRSVGQMVIAPDDPQMAVTFALGGAGAIASWPAMAVLTVVAGVIGTIITGRRPREAGAFAAGIGLAGLSLTGGSMQLVLGYHATTTAEGRRALMTVLALDTLLWTGIMAVVWFSVMLAWHWLWENGTATADEPSDHSSGSVNRSVRVTASSDQPFWSGWPALVITGVVGVFVIWITVGREPTAEIHRGQTIASVAGGLYLGAFGARYFAGIDRAIWYVLAVPAIALTGYLLGYLNAELNWAHGASKYFAFLATTPPHDLVRPLPIDYIAVGVPAALMGYWSGAKMEDVAGEGTT